MIYAGVDVGSTNTKVALLDQEARLLGWSVRRSGTDFSAAATGCLDDALAAAGLADRPNEMRTVSTGCGRKNVLNRDDDKTEISCHARGSFHFFPRAITVVDIGGQDSKIIKLDAQGRRIDFKMNRKCAAGTGAFLEETARRLDIPLEDLDTLARQSTEIVELGSYCTVFTATEVIEKIRQGKRVPDIVKGLFLSVVRRVLEMDVMGEEVVATGGVVAFNPYLVTLLSEKLGRAVLTPPHPQLTGAWGAALFAMELSS
ncbi:MAG: ATPase [Chloroflexi bacterium]|nr:ATPase [Chloroflexota bacterium]